MEWYLGIGVRHQHSDIASEWMATDRRRIGHRCRPWTETMAHGVQRDTRQRVRSALHRWLCRRTRKSTRKRWWKGPTVMSVACLSTVLTHFRACRYPNPNSSWRYL